MSTEISRSVDVWELQFTLGQVAAMLDEAEVSVALSAPTSWKGEGARAAAEALGHLLFSLRELAERVDQQSSLAAQIGTMMATDERIRGCRG